MLITYIVELQGYNFTCESGTNYIIFNQILCIYHFHNYVAV